MKQIIETQINTHFIAGAQKNMVLGPAACSQSGRTANGTNLSATVITLRYIADIIRIWFLIKD